MTLWHTLERTSTQTCSAHDREMGTCQAPWTVQSVVKSLTIFSYPLGFEKRVYIYIHNNIIKERSYTPRKAGRKIHAHCSRKSHGDFNSKVFVGLRKRWASDNIYKKLTDVDVTSRNNYHYDGFLALTRSRRNFYFADRYGLRYPTKVIF